MLYKSQRFHKLSWFLAIMIIACFLLLSVPRDMGIVGGWTDNVIQAQLLNVNNSTNSASNPYIIQNAGNLCWWLKNKTSNSYARLVDNIDMSAHTYNISKTYSNNIQLDGNGCAISGLSGEYPLFGTVSGKLVCKNLVINASISSSTQSNLAILVGKITGDNCEFTDISIHGSVNSTKSGANVASFVAETTKALNFEKCFNNAKITTDKATSVGAFVGAGGGAFTCCANFEGIETKAQNVGGFVGLNNVVTAFDRCFNSKRVFSGQIIVEYTAGGVGGFVGETSKQITFVNCYNTGEIKAEYTIKASGFVGNDANNTISISNCYNTGKIETDYDFREASDTTITFTPWDYMGTLYDKNWNASGGYGTNTYSSKISGLEVSQYSGGGGDDGGSGDGGSGGGTSGSTTPSYDSLTIKATATTYTYNYNAFSSGKNVTITNSQAYNPKGEKDASATYRDEDVLFSIRNAIDINNGETLFSRGLGELLFTVERDIFERFGILSKLTNFSLGLGTCYNIDGLSPYDDYYVANGYRTLVGNNYYQLVNNSSFSKVADECHDYYLEKGQSFYYIGGGLSYPADRIYLSGMTYKVNFETSKYVIYLYPLLTIATVCNNSKAATGWVYNEIPFHVGLYACNGCSAGSSHVHSAKFTIPTKPTDPEYITETISCNALGDAYTTQKGLNGGYPILKDMYWVL